MKSITLFIVAALCVIPSIVGAEPIDIRNTSGTELTVEIITTEGEQVTFTRTSDGQEFTIPLSMLDESSQQKISKWELMEKYQPDSAPFFRLGGEYVIPIDIKGNTITYFDANGQKQEVDDPQALKLRRLVEENKKALGMNPKKGFENIELIRGKNVTKFIKKNGATAVFEKNAGPMTLWKNYLSRNESMLQEISYEIFLPKDIKRSQRNYLVQFMSKMSIKSHPQINKIRNAIKTRKIKVRLDTPLPTTLSSGKWIKNKAIIRTHSYAVNMSILKNIDNTPVGVRNVAFKPVDPEANLLTLEDLIQGYNLFNSKKPFEIVTRQNTVEIHAEEDLYYTLKLDVGYEVKIVIEYENGKVDANADIFNTKGELHDFVKKFNLRERKESSGSHKTITITYDSQNFKSPNITLRVKKGRRPVSC